MKNLKVFENPDLDAEKFSNIWKFTIYVLKNLRVFEILRFEYWKLTI